MNVPEPPISPKPEEQNYFDAHWYVFYTDKGNAVLSKQGWFGTYVYDPELGMRPVKDDELVDVPGKPGWREPKEGVKIVRSEDPKDRFRDLVNEFMIQRYYEL